MIKFLVPYDFSEQAQHALDFAIGLADKYDKVTILVLHIVEVPSTVNMGTMGGGDMMPNVENQIFFIELMEKRKEEFKKMELKYAGNSFAFDTKLVIGNAFQGITEAIKEEDPTMVIMGSKGSSGLEEFIIGSNTEKVVRNASCPVLTIKTAADVSTFKKIVFASNFREDDQDLANRIKTLQDLLGAELYLVIINTPNNFETTRESAARIRTFANKYNISHAVAEIYNSSSEEAGIIEFAEDINADLIAMSTHGHTGLIHLISGSIAEDVVNHAKRPVWTYRTR